MSNVPLKQCSVGHLAPEWEFYKDPRYLDGMYPKCKFHKQERVNWRRSHSEEPYHPGEFPEERAAENEFLKRDLEATERHGASPAQPCSEGEGVLGFGQTESEFEPEFFESGSGLSGILFNSQFLRQGQDKNYSWRCKPLLTLPNLKVS